jgi:hypothetical protein
MPVLGKVDVQEFLSHLLALRGYDTRFVSYTFGNRYKYPEIARNLLSELAFLKELDSLLEIEIENKRKTIKGFILNELRESGLKTGIANLERIASNQLGHDVP